MSNESRIEFIATPTEVAFLDMLSVTIDRSRSDLIRLIMNRYVELTECAESDTQNEQIITSFIKVDEGQLLTDDDLATLWKGDVPAASALSFGIHPEERTPFMEAWQANGGSPDIDFDNAFRNALYVYILDTQ